jgi:pimeloyl-ACP methyl ester carboxylesterase
MIETYQQPLPHGITLSCRACGPRDAPVLVFVHGFPEAAFVWDELLRHFGARHRCVAPNLRGYADSTTPAAVEAYRAKHLLQDLAALIGRLGAPLEALIAHD